MITTLPEAIREALRKQPAERVHLKDPETGEVYVVVPEEEYELIRSESTEDAGAIREMYELQDNVARSAGWDDALMDGYNDYDAHKRGDRK